MEVGRIYEMPERVATVSKFASVSVPVANIRSEDKYIFTPSSRSDSVEISNDAKTKYQIAQKSAETEESVDAEANTDIETDKERQSNVANKSSDTNKVANSTTDTTELSEEQKQAIADLKARDAEVRSHEQAHLSASGGLARGGASFSYQTGPDGQKYAIGGEVQIDISAESEPKQTITKMQQVRRAALAPADPSAQDRAIANQASQIATQARSELNSGATSSAAIGSTATAVNKVNSSDKTAKDKELNNNPLNSEQDNSNSTSSKIINAMGGTGSLTVLKSDDSDIPVTGISLSKVYGQTSNQISSTLKTFA